MYKKASLAKRWGWHGSCYARARPFI